ncbi:hypothetical protein GOODEAATRI_013196, partial [Goodea atripinnis]
RSHLNREIRAELLSILSCMADISNAIHWMPPGFLWAGQGGISVLPAAASAALPVSEAEDLDSYSLIEPPPLDWRSDSSSEAGSAHDPEDPSQPPSAELLDLTSLGDSGSPLLIGGDLFTPVQTYQQVLLGNIPEPGLAIEVKVEDGGVPAGEVMSHEMLRDAEKDTCEEEEAEVSERRTGDEDHSRIQALLTQLQRMDKEPHDDHHSSLSEQEARGHSVLTSSTETTGLLFSERHQRDLLGLLQCTEISSKPHPSRRPPFGDVDAVLSVSYSQEDSQRFWRQSANGQRQRHREDSVASLPDDEYPEPVWMKLGEEPPEDETGADGEQAPEGESQPMTEVDLFISTKRIKVLTADTQAIGQAFGVAYQQFLQANGIKASDLRPGEYSNYLESQELYNGDLAHFSDSQNLRDIAITKAAGEILGLAVVESGWGSILPTVVVANLLHGGPAERCGELSIGDRIMSVNGTSLVGLPITTCQNILRVRRPQGPS